MSSTDNPSQTVIAQRVRNRVIEYLGTASSYEEQREYERNAPISHVPSEMINQWEDHVNGKTLSWFTEPVFSLAEQAAIKEFHSIWNRVADELPKMLPPLSKLIATQPWERLRQGAELALKVFEARGKFDEDRDIFAR
jgi:hypothetical protein